jgi:hypothetical protein
MYLDTTHNSLHTVLSNIHSAFLETALKTHTYIRCLPSNKQPSSRLVINAISDLVELAFVLMKSKGRKERSKCAVKKKQVEWMAFLAFREVLGRRQSKYRGVMQWIDGRIGGLRVRVRERETGMCERMEGVVKQIPAVE